MTTATARLGAAPRLVSIAGPFALLLAAFAALHAAMLAYDLVDPARFLAAGGAPARLAAIEAFAQVWRGGGDVAGFLAARAMAADWLPHAFLYLAGGPLAIIAAQVLLALASIAWVREIGLRLALPESKASGAAALYGVLPHALVLPHQLAAEALFVPLVVLSFAIVLRGPAAVRHAGAGLAMGLAALARPALGAWPAIHALFAWRARPAARIGYLLLGLAPVAAAALAYAQSGEMPMARGLAEAARAVAAQPAAAAAQLGRDLLALSLGSGFERALAGYFDLPREHPALAVAALAGAALFGFFMALAALGAYVFLRTGRLMLVVYALYALAAAAAAGGANALGRAPAEFALCLLAATGVWALQRRGEATPQRRAPRRVEPTLGREPPGS